MLDSLNLVIAGKALQVSLKLGVFEQLEKAPEDVSALSQKLKCSEEGMQVLIDCLVVMDYLDFEDKKLTLTDRARKFFLSDSENSLRNVVLFSDYIFDALNYLEKNVKRGGPSKINLDEFSEKQWDIFNKAMVEVARTNAEEIVNKIHIPDDYSSMLDLGGSHGLHSIEFCKKNPNLEAKILDLEPTRKIAEEMISEHDLNNRVEFVTGDFHQDDIGKNYDLIIAFNIIHGLNKKQNNQLAQRVYDALNVGGKFVLMDQIKDARGKSQLSNLIASSMGVMLFNQAGGKTYTFEEVKEWMENVGFKKIRLESVREPGSALIIGMK